MKDNIQNHMDLDLIEKIVPFLKKYTQQGYEKALEEEARNLSAIISASGAILVSDIVLNAGGIFFRIGFASSSNIPGKGKIPTKLEVEEILNRLEERKKEIILKLKL